MSNTENQQPDQDSVEISDVMVEKYTEYATTVVLDRALPDVRDGLKPVHRRILYTMYDGKYDWTAGLSKSARIVGDVMGKYHPHGDSSIYDAMARLTQEWVMSAPLIEGQGNFGSMDGDSPAAMRYTEARLEKIAKYLVDGIRENTVSFSPNYDGTLLEPDVLPTAFPNILVNGGSGVAVGMASSVPPHNLGEVVEATLMRIEKPDCDLSEILSVLPAPDFPTGARIMGMESVRKGYETGRSTFILEAIGTPDMDGKNPILVYTDVPWGVNKTNVIKVVKGLIEAGEAPEIISVRDESDRQGVRFVIEMKPGSDPDRVDALVKSKTELRTTISMNLRMIDQNGVPREMSLLAILDAWIAFRKVTVRKRFNHELAQLRDKGRLLLGRMAALSVMDKVIKIIRGSQSKAEAREGLMGLSFRTEEFEEFISVLASSVQRKAKRFALSEEQADHILEMRLQRLTGMEREALHQEAKELIKKMVHIRETLRTPEMFNKVITDQLREIRDGFPTPRRTEMEEAAVSVRAKVAPPAAKRTPIRVLITQSGLIRAGKAEVEGVLQEIESDTHSCVVAFTRRGHAYGFSPEALPVADGKDAPRSLTGILGLRVDDEIAAYVSLAPDTDAETVLTFVSADGYVRRTSASEFFRIPQPGKQAMGISDTDPDLLTVFAETPDAGAVFIGTQEGKVIRFAMKDIRVMAGRGSRGVRGIKLAEGDKVVSAFGLPDLALTPEICDEAETIWLGKRKTGSEEAQAAGVGVEIVQVAESGLMKRTIGSAYRQTNRDNRGINDKGPSKKIGKILFWAPMRPDQEAIVTVEGGDLRSIRREDVKKGARATTGASLES